MAKRRMAGRALDAAGCAAVAPEARFALTRDPRRRRGLTEAQAELFLDARRLAAALAQVVQLGAAHVAAALDLDAAISGLYSWNVRSTPSPLEILRTMKLLFRPRLRLAMTTPS